MKVFTHAPYIRENTILLLNKIELILLTYTLSNDPMPTINDPVISA